MSDGMQYLRFEEKPVAGLKTLLIFVVSKSNGAVLGEIKWFGRWRQYCFFPAAGTVFNATCLQDIQDYIEDKMAERRSS